MQLEHQTDAPKQIFRDVNKYFDARTMAHHGFEDDGSADFD
jgi:hypothetical protein